MKKIAVFVALLPLSCGIELVVPDGTQIECRSDADCPGNFTCQAETSRCVPAGNGLPNVSIETVQRSTTTVDITLRVVDNESDPVTLAAEIIEGGVGQSITLAPLEVQSSPQGTETTISWDALSFFGDASLRQGLVLRIVPSDPLSAGIPALSEPFDFGNSAPVLSAFQIVGGGSSIAGVFELSFAYEDASNDDFDVESLSIASATTNLNAAIDSVTFPDNDFTALDGTQSLHTLRVRTTALSTDTLSDVTLSMTVVDASGGISAAAQISALTIDNTPVVSLSESASASRAVQDAEFDVVVSDPTLDAAMDDADVAIEISTDNGVTWATGTLAAPATDLVPDGRVTNVTWSVGQDAGIVGSTQRSADVFDSAMVPVADYWPVLLVRARATDAAGNTSVSNSMSIPVGDVPPAAVFVSVPTNASADVVVSYSLTDPASDPADVQLQFRLTCGSCETHWRTAAIAQGSSTNLATTPGGREHVLVWDSSAQLEAGAGSASTPQGIGASNYADVELRLRSGNSVDSVVSVDTVFPVGNITQVNNQTAPRLVDIEIPSLELRGGNNPVRIGYTLIDAQSDMVDLLVHFSNDGGSIWHVCGDWNDPTSSGRYDLPTAPSDPATGGGIRHVYMCHPKGVPWIVDVATLFRIQASDGQSQSTTFAQSAGFLGPTRTAPNAVPYSVVGSYTDPDGPFHWNVPGTGDITGDGILDLLAPGGNDLHIMEGAPTNLTGAPTFTSIGTISQGAGSGPRAVALADFDQDGILDYASANYGTDEITIGIGMDTGGVPNGMFEAPVPYTADNTPCIIGVGDVNGDDILDVVSGNEFGISVTTLLGNGDGTFSNEGNAQGALASCSLAFGDLNGDGLGDVATAGALGGDIAINLSQIDMMGNWSYQPTIQLFPSTDLYDVEAADLTGDGILDLIATGNSDREIIVLPGVGDGTFDTPHRYPTPAQPQRIAAADFNLDGADDFAVGTANASNLFFVLGGSSAAEPVLITGEVSVFDVRSLVAADVNSDGVPDLVTSGSTPRVLSPTPFATLGPSVFASARDQSIVSSVVDIEVADFDLDGVPDVLANTGFLTYGAGGVRVPFGQLQQGIEVGSTNSGGRLIVGDIDADGILEFITGGDVWSFTRTEGAPDQVATLGATLTAGGNDGVIADFDGDGFGDLAVHRPQMPNGFLEIHLSEVMMGAWTGNFRAPQSLLGYDLLDVAAADLDFDGDMDIVGIETDTLHTFENNGPGTFSAWTMTSISSSASELIVADLNGDGVLDALIGRNVSGGNEVNIALGGETNGAWDQTFPSVTLFSLAQNDGNPDLEIADLNSDGHLDLLAPDEDIGITRVAQGIGDGGFQPVQVVGTAVEQNGGGFARQVAVIDLDGDGMTDVVRPAERASVRIRLGQDESYTSYSRRLVPLGTSPVPPFSALFVGDVPGTTTDRFEQPREPQLAQWRIRRFSDRHATMAEALQHQGLVTGGAMVPFTDAWRTQGDIRWLAIESSSLPRLYVYNRLGPVDSANPAERQGLDLTTEGANRGIIIDLPFANGRVAGDLAGAEVYVYQRITDWARASDYPDDDLTADPDASEKLPIVEDALSAQRRVVRPIETWRRIPVDTDTDFATGTGPRYIVSTNESIQVLVERLGDFQVYYDPTP